jgi:hypothetical protein
MIPYDDITEKAGRGWTLRLLDRLTAPDLPDAELDDLVGALQAVSDPRSFGPLEAVVCDTGRPARTRQAASTILSGLHHVAFDVPQQKLRRWWREGDTILHRHALMLMDGLCCPGIVLQVASDPRHPLQAEALTRMDFWFDLPEYEAVKMAALSHPDPEVRRNAAYVLLWDEPVAAEGPLIGATRDPVPEVAVEAVNTLKYYPSRRTLRCLHRLLDHANDEVRQQAEESFAEVRGEMLDRLRSPHGQVAARVRAWLRPVWRLLALTDAELRPGEKSPPAAAADRPVKGRLPMPALLDLLTNPDTSPLFLRDALWQNDWPGYAPAERRRLREVLLAHPDPLVREQAAGCLATWRDAEGLLMLAADANFIVRKQAMYHLGTLPPTPQVAEFAWEHLARADALGVHATETLTTFARQASAEVAIPRLERLAVDEGQRECLRVTAVEELTRLGAAVAVARLLSLLRQPPAVTWALHIALLEAVLRLELPRPDITHLLEVDNLDVQAAVASVEA